MTDEVAELAVDPAETGEDEAEDSQSSEVEETTQEETPAEKPKAKGVQKRLDELTALRRDAERREADALRDRDHWRDQATKPKTVDKPTESAKPKLDDFPNYEEFTEALTDWKVDQRLSSRSDEEKQAKADAERRTLAQTHQTREATFRESHPDFDDVAYDKRLPVTEAMAQAAFSSEKGPELLYFLGTNPNEAARIAGLSPLQSAMEMGRLEAKLSQPTRNKTSAPEPIEPVTPGGGNQTVDPDRMTTEQWVAWRRKQLG